MKTVLHIGAGNIGRGFIIPVLKNDKSFNNFIFLDINKEVVVKIQNDKKYHVNEISETKNTIEINDVYAYELDDLFKDELAKTIDEIDLITISIGQNNLIHLVKYFEQIFKTRKTQKPLIVVCCENGNRVSTYLHNLLKEKLNFEIQNTYFVDSVVDRIVPNQAQNGLDIDVEKYKSWIIDAKQWPSNVEKIQSVNYSDNLDAEINKKICLLNGVHASIAWHRYQVDAFTIPTLQEAIKESQTMEFINNLMDELVVILVKQFGFEHSYLSEYKEQIIERFKNPSLIDELYRVGRNPITKLQLHERILSPLLFAAKNKIPYKFLSETFNNGLSYFYDGDNEAQELKKLSETSSKKEVIKKVIKDISEAQIELLV